MCCGASNTFSIDLFNHPLKLDRFMSGEDEMSAIQKIAKDPSALKRPSKDNLYFGRWYVAWIYVKSPFEWIFACFTQALAGITWCIGATRLSHYFTLLTDHIGRDSEQLADQWRYGERLLVPAVNNPKLGSWDVYRYGNLPIQQIKNTHFLKYTWFRHHCDLAADHLIKQSRTSKHPEEAKEAFFRLMHAGKRDAAVEHLVKEFPCTDGRTLLNQAIDGYFTKEAIPLLNTVEFFRPRNVCNGSTLWFIHLFKQSEGLFNSIEACAMAVAEQFRTGVSSQGLLLQAVGKTDALLNCPSQLLDEYTIPTGTPREKGLQKFKELPPGVYYVSSYHHGFAYVKTHDERGYVFNPSFGLLHLSPEETLDMVHTYHYKEGDPQSTIKFQQYHCFAGAAEEAV